MRLFNRYDFTNLATFAAAIIGTFLMWRFALYASTRVDVPKLNYYGEPTGYIDPSLLWSTWTYLSGALTFVAVCGLIVVVAVEVINMVSRPVQRRIDAYSFKRREAQKLRGNSLLAASFPAKVSADNPRAGVIEEHMFGPDE